MAQGLEAEIMGARRSVIRSPRRIAVWERRCTQTGTPPGVSISAAGAAGQRPMVALSPRSVRGTRRSRSRDRHGIVRTAAHSEIQPCVRPQQDDDAKTSLRQSTQRVTGAPALRGDATCAAGFGGLGVADYVETFASLSKQKQRGTEAPRRLI